MAKVQPKQMAKHLTFFHTGVLRPGLMAMLVIAAIATILTKLTLTHTKLKCSGLRARKWMWTLYILMPFLPTPPHSLRHYSKFINFASRATEGVVGEKDVRVALLTIGVSLGNTPRVIGCQQA
jgi:hypothetical protein